MHVSLNCVWLSCCSDKYKKFKRQKWREEENLPYEEGETKAWTRRGTSVFLSLYICFRFIIGTEHTVDSRYIIVSSALGGSSSCSGQTFLAYVRSTLTSK